MLKYVYSDSVFNILCIEINTKVKKKKKFPSDKINGTKNALFFVSQAPTHHSFIFQSYMS